MPDAANVPQPVQFLPPPPRRYRVRVAVEADDLSAVVDALKCVQMAIGPETPFTTGVHGGGNWAAALALSPFAARGAQHALEVREWVEGMPAEQRAGLERTRAKAQAVGAKFGGGVGDLAQLPGIVEVVLGAGLQVPTPASAGDQPSAPAAAAAPEQNQAVPATRVLTPEPVITNLSAPAAVPTVAP
jgi:hypothetical protein